MVILQKPIAITLMVAGFILVLQAGLQMQYGCSPISPVIAVWIDELRAPHMSYSKFQSLIANKEIAQRAIERVDQVNAKYLGIYLAVKLKGDPRNYRVYRPEGCREDLLDRLNSYGIPVTLGYSCW